ncbi:hypothetical protein C0J52_27799 [Blattella germanica]|nr:hypothetical protein C0J52_27799 [Blattella germanica]
MHRYNKSSTPQKLLECYRSANKDETPYTVSEIWLKARCNYNSITYSDLGDSQNTIESSTETSQYSESDDSIFGKLDQPTTPDTAEASSTSEDPVNEDGRNLIFNIKSLIFVCFVILLIGLYVLWYKKKYPKQFEKVECQDNENDSGSQTDIMPS